MDKTKSVNLTACDSCESHEIELLIQLEGTRIELTKTMTSAIYHFLNPMIERNPKDVRVINLSAQTFAEFLDTIKSNYRNLNNLWTLQTILKLWDTVFVLQIPELIAICERKVCRRMTEVAFEAIYVRANRYQSHAVLYKARRFLKHLSVKADKMRLLSILTFRDFLSIIKDDCLRVKSEDIVLRSIFLWAEKLDKQEGSSGANEDDQQCPKRRKLDSNVPCKEENELNKNTSKLSQLLRTSRYGLASIECLQELSKHHLCEKDEIAKLVVTEAINYKLDRDTHGYWPPFTYPRNTGLFFLVGVLADKDQVSVLTLEPIETDIGSWMRFRRCPLHTQITNLTVFDNELYVISSTGFESLIFVYRNTRWNFVLDLPNKDFIVISKGNLIYVIDGTSSSVKCVSPRETPVLHSEIKFPDMMKNPESALDFDKSILIFCSTDSDERSSVVSLDVPEHKWTDGVFIKGSAKNLVGFRKETNYFILQRDGSISQVLRKLDDSIDLIFLQRLWSIQSALRGAFIYRDILYIFSNTPSENLCLNGAFGLFWKLEYWYQEQEACTFLQFSILTDDVLRTEDESDSDSEEDEDED
ncbi:kelch protein 8 [Biomphalaria glabrata]|uniref:BACK domain-containing protein n=1 Tax=Biomphalaria glabrata TaxID=6526 RepID=A0A2C9LXN1_BIOGL|nr:kelch protein 8 [Biomphalaria glabrata]